MSRTIGNAILAASLCAFAVAGCGRRTDLQRPSPPEEASKEAKEKGQNVNDRPFILDPLLR